MTRLQEAEREIFISRSPARRPRVGADADPVRTEVLRQRLNSAAQHMKLTLSRASVTSLLSETNDGGVALVDREFRLLGSAPMLPLYTGLLPACVEYMVAAVGGTDQLEPGDLLINTSPFETGSHPQDMALALPIFKDDELIGYSAVMAHVADLGAIGVYCTGTEDMFQEGLILPGVKLQRGGEWVDDIYRTLMANTRFPKEVLADVNAIIAALHSGERSLVRIVNETGDAFYDLVENIYDHGEALVRSFIEKIPDGRYASSMVVDDDGRGTDSVEIDLEIEIDGSTIRVDYSVSPDTQKGGINSALPQTVSLTRVAITDLAGAGETPNEGFYRPIEVITRPGSMFHPLPPAPTFMQSFTAASAIELIYKVLAEALPEGVPAGSAGDAMDVALWGDIQGPDSWSEYLFGAGGHGASANADGQMTLQMNGESACSLPSMEIDEARGHIVYVKNELATDSCGAGKFQGGLAHDHEFRVLDDFWLTGVLARNKMAPWGLNGGHDGRSTSRYLVRPDGSRQFLGNLQNGFAPKGSIIEGRTGGGGGFGPPSERDPEAVRRDLRDGLISMAFAREHYSDALSAG